MLVRGIFYRFVLITYFIYTLSSGEGDLVISDGKNE